MFRGLLALLGAFSLSAAGLPRDIADRVGDYASEFQAKARMTIARERLVQRAYAQPHTGFAIGAAAASSHAFYQVHEIVSEYTLAPLKGDRSGALVEFREILTKDGSVAQTAAAARQALERDVAAGQDRVRRNMLTELTSLGLLDVATDYGSILLAFTPAGQANLDMTPAGTAMVGAEPALAIVWRERSGSALEFRGNKQARHALQGTLWIRAADFLPLRVNASFEHREPKHTLRDDATVEFVRAPFGAVVPVSVVHRHFVDGRVLTENLYTYESFRLFGSESTIRFGDTPPPTRK